jgi:hypothetical protein
MRTSVVFGKDVLNIKKSHRGHRVIIKTPKLA